MKVVKVQNIEISNDLPFILIAGPCVIESREHALMMATEIKKITDEVGISFIYKSSYDKANRTSIDSYRGVTISEGMSILSEVKDKVGCPVLTDVHTEEEAFIAAKYVDVLQTPALLSRQTNLLLACGRTGLPINVKQGQFLAPGDMKNVIKKVESTGNTNSIVCYRGVSFGYNRLVVDFTSFPVLRDIGSPLIFDCTHSVQRPGGLGDKSGGDRSLVPTLAKAGVASGVAGIFMEVHNDPDNAPSDGPNMLKIEDLKELLITLKAIDGIVK